MALVFFRADDVPAALNLLSGMFGGHGVVLPAIVGNLPGVRAIADLFNLPVGELPNFGIAQVLWIAGLLAAVWALPNSQQWLRNYRTVLAAKLRPSRLQRAFPALVWRPASLVGFAMGSLGVLVVLRAISAAPTEFLYFQF
jgi:alginate O-acetyltransferase complex protein AlgI